MSKISYDALMDDFLQYDRRHVRKQDLGNLIECYNMTLRSLRDDLNCVSVKLSPLSFKEVRARPDFPGSRCPGLPYKLIGVKTKSEVFDNKELMSKDCGDWSKIGFGKCVHLPDVCLFGRAQLAVTGNEKIRAEWGYSFDAYIEEARFFYPIFDYIKAQKHTLSIAYGFEMAEGGMPAINDLLKNNEDAKFAIIDWSKFDKTPPVWFLYFNGSD